MLVAVAGVVGVVIAALRGRGTQVGRNAPVLTNGLSPAGLEASHYVDTWEGTFADSTETFPVIADLRIDYTNAKAGDTQRTVSIRECGLLDGTMIIIGHCQLRNATRTFRTDRIRRCFDASTGEQIFDVPDFLRRKYFTSPAFSVQRLLDEESDAIKVMVYLARANARLTEPKVRACTEACIALVKDARIEASTIKDILKKTSIPTLPAIKTAISRLSKADKVRHPILLAFADKIVSAQNKLPGSDVDAIGYLRKKLATSPRQ